MSSRRDFLKASAAAAAVAGARAATGAVIIPPAPLAATSSDPFADEMALLAIDAARSAGASYADARVGRYRRQFVATRERQVTAVADSESFGIGVRALVNGAWGFAATSTLTRDAVQSTAREAVRIARAARAVQKKPVELAPVQAVKGTWRTPITRDPVDVAIEDKVALLLAANEAALKVPNIRFVNSGLQLLREEKTLATTDGTLVTQTFVRVGPQFTATAIADGDFQSYTEELAPRGQGWEYVESLDMPGNAERWASLAAEKLTAKSVEVGRYDLILDPTRASATPRNSIAQWATRPTLPGRASSHRPRR
jgi:TldD protein